MIDFTSPRAIWNDLQTVKAENARLLSALERIAQPSTVSGMHDQDRAPKLQRIAAEALAVTRPHEKSGGTELPSHHQAQGE
jgi:hypothetical protein